MDITTGILCGGFSHGKAFSGEHCPHFHVCLEDAKNPAFLEVIWGFSMELLSLLFLFTELLFTVIIIFIHCIIIIVFYRSYQYISSPLVDDLRK